MGRHHFVFLEKEFIILHSTINPATIAGFIVSVRFAQAIILVDDHLMRFAFFTMDRADEVDATDHR